MASLHTHKHTRTQTHTPAAFYLSNHQLTSLTSEISLSSTSFSKSPFTFVFICSFHYCIRTKTSMAAPSPSSSSSSASLPPLPEERIILGCGGIAVDLLAAVASYPKPDEKIRTTSFKVQGGGNAGNALTCAAHLGLLPRVISKVADDIQGKAILDELKADGVDTSFVVVSEGGISPFSYIIVDNQTQTRTCIHTPGYPPMVPEDLSESNLSSALDGTRLVYFDGRLHQIDVLIALEAKRRGVPILIDAERIREDLDNLLSLSDYVICSTKFPQEFTGATSVASALVSMLLTLPKIKFAIVTLGEDGCVMLERTSTENIPSEEMDVEDLLETLKQRIDSDATTPTCISSVASKLRAKGIGILDGRLLVGTAEKISASELVDTTGAGDAFVGAVLYAICANMPPEKMLPFAAQVAAISCRALGARTGLPYLTDHRLASFLR